MNAAGLKSNSGSDLQIHFVHKHAECRSNTWRRNLPVSRRRGFKAFWVLLAAKDWTHEDKDGQAAV